MRINEHNKYMYTYPKVGNCTKEIHRFVWDEQRTRRRETCGIYIGVGREKKLGQTPLQKMAYPERVSAPLIISSAKLQNKIRFGPLQETISSLECVQKVKRWFYKQKKMPGKPQVRKTALKIVSTEKIKKMIIFRVDFHRGNRDPRNQKRNDRNHQFLCGIELATVVAVALHRLNSRHRLHHPNITHSLRE